MECKDKNCPKHGSLSTRGLVLDGAVVSDKMQGTILVQKDRFVKVKKYDRIKKKTMRVPAHNPPCINARTGDIVRIMECRKISKTVSFVVIEKLSKKDELPVQEKPKKIPKKKPKKQEVDNG